MNPFHCAEFWEVCAEFSQAEMGTESKNLVFWKCTLCIAALHKMRHQLIFTYLFSHLLSASGREVEAVNPMWDGDAFSQSRFK